MSNSSASSGKTRRSGRSAATAPISPCCPVATQQSWKDSNNEWQARTEWHRVVVFDRLGESIPDTLHKGDHVLVDGQLVSSKYENENGKSEKAKAAIFWSVRANSVRRLSRTEAEVPAQASVPEPTSNEALF
jgi:single stranded DNA-binding protein